MKITKQTIAAAGFAALLFAPLAQAQTSSATANIDIVVINSGGMRIEAFDMSFGSIPSGVTDQSWILTCTADNNVVSSEIQQGNPRPTTTPHAALSMCSRELTVSITSWRSRRTLSPAAPAPLWAPRLTRLSIFSWPTARPPSPAWTTSTP